ncbi:conjugal transfer protein TraB [Ensifer canadensis]
MRREQGLVVGLVALSVTAGWVGWSGKVLLLPVAFAFPVLWSQAPTRIAAVLVSAGYFLAASRGLPQGVATYYAVDLWSGILPWATASFAFVAVHTALWSERSRRGRAVGYAIASLLMAVPPFGITGWAHPITAAGVVFPEWGWFGFAIAAAGLAVLTTWLWPAAAIAISGFWLWSAAFWTDPALPEGWREVDLKLGAGLGRESSLQWHRDLIATVQDEAKQGARLIVLPESALGFWTPTVERIWTDGLSGLEVGVLAGAAVAGRDGYDNAIVNITSVGSAVVYRARMPVPGSMWQPWRIWSEHPGGARAHFFANPVAEIDGLRIAPLICYEQLLVWPFLQSMTHAPDVVVAIGNGWWTQATSIVSIQRASALAWARLFGKPVAVSFNI